MLENGFIHHHFTVIAQEHLVSPHMGTNLQLYHRIVLLGGQRRTVTTYEDRTLDDGGMISIFTLQTDGHLLSIGTEGVQGIDRGGIARSAIVEVAIFVAVFIPLFIVRIGIGTVTTAIDVTADSGVDTDGITAIDRTRHVVTAIDIVDITATYQHTGCQLVRELINQVSIFVLVLQVRTRRIVTVYRWHHVSHTATTIDIVNHQRINIGYIRVNLQQQTLWTGHLAAVTTTIEVTDLTALQVPRRTDMHLCLVVTTKQTAYLELVTLDMFQR